MPLTLNQYLKICGFNKLGKNIDQSLSQKSFLISQLRMPNIKNILEIGFNAGHSSFLFLTKSKAKVVSFDLANQAHSAKAKTYLDSRFPGRHQLVTGDSKAALPDYVTKNPNQKFDLIFIDGSTDPNVTWSDLRNCKNLAHKDTIVVMNNVVLNQKWRKPENVGPTETWNKARAKRLVVEHGHIDLKLANGWSWGKFVLV